MVTPTTISIIIQGITNTTNQLNAMPKPILKAVPSVHMNLYILTQMQTMR